MALDWTFTGNANSFPDNNLPNYPRTDAGFRAITLNALDRVIDSIPDIDDDTEFFKASLKDILAGEDYLDRKQEVEILLNQLATYFDQNDELVQTLSQLFFAFYPTESVIE